MKVNGSYLGEGLFSALYSTKRIPELAKLIYDAYNGHYKQLGQGVFNALFVQGADLIAFGMYLSGECAERGLVGQCRQWPVTPVSSTVGSNMVSYLPTLVLTGQYDPVTPPDY